MIRHETDLGTINVGKNVFHIIAGHAATKCFGVKGMAMRSVKDGLVHMLRREAMAKGVFVTPNEDGTINIDMHIVVDQNVNLPAVADSIISEVRYMVSKETETEVHEVNVFIDSMSEE